MQLKLLPYLQYVDEVRYYIRPRHPINDTAIRQFFMKKGQLNKGIIGLFGSSPVTPRDEIGFRKIYSDLVRDQKITTIFRPGERTCNLDKGFCEGETINIKIIDKVGADWAKLPPETISFNRKALILTAINKKIGELNSLDFRGASPDIFDKQSLIYNLGVTYNLPPSELTDDSIITKTTFTYL